MPLGEPPAAAGSLAKVPSERLARKTLFRVWKAGEVDTDPRSIPWWFASLPTDPADPAAGGRFDLPAPLGTCYAATRRAGAVLEALQANLVNLPKAELRARSLARITVPTDAPRAARLTARVLAGRLGITAALWAGQDRALTQRWAFAFRRDGWWALYAGIQHDPSGRLRGVALFDHGGSHPPSYGGRWTTSVGPLCTDEVFAALARYGVGVREPGDLPFADLDSVVSSPTTT